MKSLFLLIATASVAMAGKSAYDPSLASGKVETRLTEFTYGQREVPLKVYLPERKPAPLILMSHGLGGSREACTYLGEHWAGRGFVVVAMQHAGSDETVWKDAPRAGRLASLTAAVNAKSFMGRMGDVPATLDQLEKWNAGEWHFLKGRMDLEHIGMAGHSYGAVTTQALCGQAFAVRGRSFADERIDAGVALSPSPPQMGDARQAFGSVKRPMMLMTGTEDRSMIGSTTPEQRREVYAAMPAGSKYELVLDGARHLAFGDTARRDGRQRNPEHHGAIKALSAAFWDAHLKTDPAAKAWLEGDKPAGLLADQDLWQRK